MCPRPGFEPWTSHMVTEVLYLYIATAPLQIDRICPAVFTTVNMSLNAYDDVCLFIEYTQSAANAISGFSANTYTLQSTILK